MVERTGGYYGKAFQGARGVTQGDLIPPTIFSVVVDVVVDVVVRYWVTVMVEGAEERGKHRQEGRHQAALFFVDDGMVAS